MYLGRGGVDLNRYQEFVQGQDTLHLSSEEVQGIQVYVGTGKQGKFLVL